MTQTQRMLAGELYRADDPDLVTDAACAAAWMARYNAATTVGRQQAGPYGLGMKKLPLAAIRIWRADREHNGRVVGWR